MAINFINIVSSNNIFAIDLYRDIIASKPEQSNILFSPFSITAALALINIGAQGATRNEISSAIHQQSSNGDLEEINYAYRELFSRMVSIEDSKNVTSLSYRHDHVHQKPEVRLANRIYVDLQISLKPTFSTISQSFFGSSTGKVNFAANPGEAVDIINGWVEETTNGKIKEMFPEVDSSTKLAVVSALYFKAEWEQHFIAEDTFRGDFFGLGPETKSTKTEFMSKISRQSKLAEIPELDTAILQIPYYTEKSHMLILLPNKNDGLARLEASLTRDVFENVRYKEHVVKVVIPKFKVEQEYDLKSQLKNLGIQKAFLDDADFHGISDMPLQISNVAHKTFLGKKI